MKKKIIITLSILAVSTALVLGAKSKESIYHVYNTYKTVEDGKSFLQKLQDEKDRRIPKFYKNETPQDTHRLGENMKKEIEKDTEVIKDFPVE